jgi:hypothetical protein
MLLREIREKIALAKIRLAEINPAIKSYPVVVINCQQFPPHDFEPETNALLMLIEYPEIFAPNQNIRAIVDFGTKISGQKDRIELLEKKINTNLKIAIGRLRVRYDSLLESAKRACNDNAIEALLNECAQKVEELSKKSSRNKELLQEKKLLDQLRKDFHRAIEGIDFFAPTVELRFYELDMRKIQEIKEHPLIQKAGKTDLSPSSIRVVIA